MQARNMEARHLYLFTSDESTERRTVYVTAIERDRATRSVDVRGFWDDFATGEGWGNFGLSEEVTEVPTYSGAIPTRNADPSMAHAWEVTGGSNTTCRCGWRSADLPADQARAAIAAHIALNNA